MMISERMTVSVLNQHDRRQRESLRPRHDLKPFDEVIDPRRSIKGEPHIAFVVGVVGKGFSVRVEIDPVGISKTASENRPRLVILRDRHPMAQGSRIRILRSGEIGDLVRRSH